MGLTGIDPTDPTPHDARELLLNQGPSTSGTSRDVLFYGNKTSAGSATVDTYDDTPINDETDAITRWGRRSELLAMYRAYTMVDQSANIRGIAVTESGGTAASCKLTLSGTSDQSSTITVTITGLDVTLSVAVGDTPAVSGAALVSAINNADDGRLQVSASGAVNGADYDVTVTAAQKGPRGDFIIGNTAKRGVRAKIETTGATNAMTIAKGSVVAGTTADDGTSAIAAAAQAENYYQVAPWHSSNGAG
ncbi:MAG: hypothetical protein ACE5F9_15750, partial [Phycisphaerae bacterium]